MPLDEKGRLYLTYRHGMFVWLCVILWMSAWAGIGCLLNHLTGWETTSLIIALVGESCFGVVPMYFLWKEEKRSKNGNRRL